MKTNQPPMDGRSMVTKPSLTVHPDRKHIRPTVDEVAKLRVKGENFAWRVSEDFLRREVPIGEASSKPGSASHGATAAAGSDALIDMLRKELDIVDAESTESKSPE